MIFGSLGESSICVLLNFHMQVWTSRLYSVRNEFSIRLKVFFFGNIYTRTHLVAQRIRLTLLFRTNGRPVALTKIC